MSTQFDIGDTVRAVVKGKEVSGRIVGIEPSSGRRGYPPTGEVYHVVQGDSPFGAAVEVHSSAVQEAPR